MINLIGNINIDLIMAQVSHRPDFNEEHMVDEMIIRPGGLANVVYPLAKLNERPRLISAIGNDQFGDMIVKEMGPLIEDSLVRINTPSAVSVSVVDQLGSRYFVTYSGHFYGMTDDIVKRCIDFEKADACFLYGYFLMPNFGVEETQGCLMRAKENRQLIFFDANSAIDGWSEKSCNEIFSLLPYIDYFMPNDEELLHLTGASSIEEGVEILFNKGANQIVVKCGDKGATAYLKNDVIHHSGYPTKAYDTTGAGDSFNAGFMYKLVNGSDMKTALAFGNALASIVVSRKDNRYPDITEIEEVLNIKC
ncbi:hypothetical protein GMB86_10155 [Terrilactibacillus sp. BCM23-1]|uniref:Carbohydrate kinase PfkB domain-containing protein n=1 Tax=Terrilactibacillus tamarindi TaxID=2599694 RepID=A0A6N8CRV0_9BACI|nr:carbohydrate kinase family protein [Terrilactibacillus tamarindi]MTT32368.1 hypothetical protein [Terrilactibacillus tamarindi]